ncbi:MAG: Recombinase [Berkelbacteria bacterium GW2011_GWB1_38_5]|uniref:Recombinase n=1 Tax=Berkelbacteria bacterium GW2011_GWB1_38_5 TaxID=1618336 RepID=A0A0G0NBB5_9BACT|nr:MAG: Recombinase [Berkelbacteria bacterium GW2011_GWB1_38_5]
MLAQVEVWEKETKQSSHIFVQKLENKIIQTDGKLDKLINAFLDNDIEKEIYLKKKEELLQTKIALEQQKTDFGRKGNNWIEPLKEWIFSAHQAEKLAFSNDFSEIKYFVKKIGTNHQLFDKKVAWNLKTPYAILARYKRQIGEATPPKRRGSGAPNDIKISKSLCWSGCADSNCGPPRPKRGALPAEPHPAT